MKIWEGASEEGTIYHLMYINGILQLFATYPHRQIERKISTNKVPVKRLIGFIAQKRVNYVQDR